MNKILKEIEEKKFYNAYLITGEEEYLVKYYRETLVNSLISKDDSLNYMNYVDYSKEKIDGVIDFISSMPFFGERKVLVFENSTLFKSGKKEDGEKILEAIKNMPPTSVIIFSEREKDGKISLYKTFKKDYRIIECNRLSENILYGWVKKEFNKKNLNISDKILIEFTNRVGNNMNEILREIEKLEALYKNSNEEISLSIINNFTSKNAEYDIFLLSKAILNKNVKEIRRIYEESLDNGVEHNSLLGLLEKNYGDMVLIKEGIINKLSISEITKITGIKEWIIKKNYIDVLKSVELEYLRDRLEKLIEIDKDRNEGRQDVILGVEGFIFS